MHIVTVSTKNDGYLDYLIESCKRNGGDLKILGLGQEWKGFMMKIKLLIEYLNNLDDDDIVCYVDGYDVIILQDVNKIETIFRNSGSKILLSRDSKSSFFLFELISSYYFGKSEKCNLNAGTFIGYVKYLKKLFNNMCKDYNCNNKDLDDQIILTKICNQYNNNNKDKDLDIDIDINREIFLVINEYDSDRHKIQIQNNELIFNNKKPCIIHGVLNYNLNNILKKLNYNVVCNKRRDNLNYLLTTTFFKKIIIVIIIIVITIIVIIVLFNNKKLIHQINLNTNKNNFLLS